MWSRFMKHTYMQRSASLIINRIDTGTAVEKQPHQIQILQFVTVRECDMSIHVWHVCALICDVTNSYATTLLMSVTWLLIRVNRRATCDTNAVRDSSKMWQESFICDVTHSYVTTLLVSATWLFIRVDKRATLATPTRFVTVRGRDRSRSYVTWLIYMSRHCWWVWHDSSSGWQDVFTCVTHAIARFVTVRGCDINRSWVWHDSFTSVTWLVHTCHTRSKSCCSWQFVNVAWVVYMVRELDMTRSWQCVNVT